MNHNFLLQNLKSYRYQLTEQTIASLWLVKIIDAAYLYILTQWSIIPPSECNITPAEQEYYALRELYYTLGEQYYALKEYLVSLNSI